MTLAELSLKRPVTASMFFVSLLLVGLIAGFRLPLEFFPEVEAPFLYVDLPYPGSSPEEIEQIITRPAEEALATLPGIRRINSQSRADGAGVFMEFDWSRNVQVAAAEARERLDTIRDEFPSDFQRFYVLKFATSDQPMLRLRIASGRDLTDAYPMLEREVKRRIERLPGVARVDISGVAAPEVEIELQNDRVTAHGIDLNQLAQRLQEANFSVSAGQITEVDRRLRVQPVGELRSLDALRDLVLNDAGIRLGDIAELSLKPARLDYARRLDLRPAVGFDIFKERSANLVEVSRLVMAEVDEITQIGDFDGIQMFVLDNQGDGVTSSLVELGHAGLVGSLLSILVLFFFLRHWPSTLMVALAIPICFVMTLGCMYFFGISLNVLSMMGLLLGVGMLVDNAVVVVESIYQKREKYPDNPWLCAIEGTRGVQLAITAGTLTSIIVFLPNIFGERNFIAIYLSQVAITITISLLCSWLVAVSLIPMISSRIGMPPSLGKQTGLIHRLKSGYARLLGWSLQHRWKSVLMIGLVMLVSFFPATQTKFDMFPSGETRELELQYRWKGSYRLEELSAAVDEVEQYLHENREEFQITQIYSWFSERGWAGTQIKLREDGDGLQPTLALMERIREGLPKLALGEVGFQQQMRGSSGEGLEISLIGDSSEVLKQLADAVIPGLASLDGLRDVRTDLGAESREIQIRVDRERALAFGFSAQQIASYVGIALRGVPLREFRADTGEVPMWLRFQNSDAASVDDLRDYKLPTPDGRLVPLMSMIDIEIRTGASTITRQNRQTALPIKINLVEGTTMDDARASIESAMEAVNLPAGYRWNFGGSFDESEEAGNQMLFNTLIALLMVYVVMAALFESLVFPSAIITSFLFSIFGVFWLFWLTGTTFSLMASIGILILMGVVVNNGIVMFEHVAELRRDGMRRDEALVQGCRDRLRPIMMTMGTTILGMLPLCIGSTQIGGDGPPYYPMARAIVGGLVFSTLVSLLALPTIYAVLDDWRLGSRRLWRDARRRGQPAASTAAGA